jgi:outer membrane protein assembly complex protein YaeT
LGRRLKLRLAATVLTGILALLVLFVALLHMRPVRRYALAQSIRMLARQGVDVDAGEVDYNLFTSTATLGHVTVRSRQTPDLPPLVRVEQIHVDLNVWKLLRGKFYLEDAQIRKPVIHLVIDEAGRDNIPHLPASSGSSSPEIDFLIRKLRLSGGSLRVEELRLQIDTSLPLWQLAIDGDSRTKDHLVRLEAQQPGRIAFQQRTLAIPSLTVEVVLQKNALDIHGVKLGLGDSIIAFSGRLDHFQDPRYDIKTETDLALESITQFAGVPQKIGGTVHASLTATGPLAQMRATARLDGQNLTVERLNRLGLKAEIAYDASSARIQIASFNLASPAGAIQGKGSVALNTAAGESTLNAAVRGLDLAQLSRTFQLPMRIASSAAGELAAHWPALAFDQAAGDASLRLMAAQAEPARDVVPVSGAIQAKATGNRVVVGISALTALHAHATGQLTLVDRRALSGALKLDAPDLTTAIAGAEKLLGRSLGTPVGGALSADAVLSGTIEKPSAAVTLSSNNLQAGTLSGIAVRAALNYSPSRLRIQDSVVEWQDQQITASGTIGLQGAEPPVALQAHASALSIAALLAAAGRQDLPVSGTVSLDANVGGTTQHPQAHANIAAGNLAAYHESIGSLTADAGFSDRLLTVTQLRLGNGTLQATGSYNLESKDYTIALASRNLRLTSLELPDGSAVRGSVTLQARGQGNLDNPSATVSFSATDVQYRDQQFGSLTLQASAANQRAEIQATAPLFNLSAKANAGLQEPNPVTFELTANHTDLATLPLKLQLPVAGTVTATVRCSADLKNYEQGLASAEVAKLDITYNGQPVTTDGPLVASYQNRMLTIGRAVIVAGQSRVSVEGKLPLDDAAGTGAIHIASTLNLAGLRTYLPAMAPDAGVIGDASISGTVTGTLKKIDPNLTITLDQGSVSGAGFDPPLGNLTLRAQIRDGALELEKASGDWGPAKFQASGVIPLTVLPADLPVAFPRRQGPAQFTAELNQIDISALPGVPKDVTGAVSARIEAQAARPEVEAITAKLTFPTLRIGLGTYNLEQSGISTVTVANGAARIEQLQLTGPQTDIKVTGTAGLLGAHPLDLHLAGAFDASLVGAFTEAVRARGATQLVVAVTGAAESPQVQGYVQLTDAQISLQSPRLALDSLNARIDLAGARATLSRLDGSLNGGTLSGSGSLEYADGQLRNTNLNLKAGGVYLDFPAGLKTLSNVDLTARNTAANLVLSGEVVILEGGFTDDLGIDTGILAAVSAPRGMEFTEDPNPLLKNTRFNIGIRTDSPIYVKNNLAKAEITADLRLIGGPYEPALSGRLTLEEGSQLNFNERKYTVERGNITFTSERRIEPNLDIMATTTAGGLDITLQVSGVPGKTETTLTSDPPEPEQDILAVLLTGKKLDEIRSQEFTVARNQVLSYLTGRVGSSLGRGIAGATGLSSVRIEPNLIANEANPGARLTIGQDITPKLNLIYSMDLINSSDQIYVGEYDFTRRFSTRGVRQSDGSFRGDFRHDLRFGGVPEPKSARRMESRRIDKITIRGITYFPEEKLASKLGVKQGQKYDFFKVRRGADNVDKLFTRENLLQANVRLKRDSRDVTVDLTLDVNAGPVVDFVYEGIAADGGLKKRVRETWRNGVFDSQRAEDAVQEIRSWLVKAGKLQPVIAYKILKPSLDRVSVVFDIQPGPQFSNVEIAFDGAKGIAAKDLREIVKSQKLSEEVYMKPSSVTELLTRYYQEQGYLDAKVDNPRYELSSETRTGKVTFPVQEGPLYHTAGVEFQGNTVFDTALLTAALPLPKGEEYRPVLRERTLQKLRELYWEKGYNDMEANIATNRGKAAGELDAVVKITENRQSVAREIVVEGNDKTSEGLIRAQIEVKPGDILNLQKLSNSRRNLYHTAAYSLVEITQEDVEAESPAAGQKPVRLRVRVREVQPFQLRYGAFYDTERGPGIIADLTNRNSLGSARSLGLRTRYDAQLQEVRLYFTQPLLRRFPVSTTVSPYVRHERNPATSTSDAFNVDRTGISIQQEAKFRRKYVVTYGYRIEKSRTYDTGPDPFFNIPLRIAALTATVTRETRDDVLDATHGQFFSHAFQYSPELLGSQLRFVKYFGQYFRYFPLQKPKVQLFTNQVLRPRLVYATGVRVGLATGLGGQEITLGERFLAGGSTTIRGFQQNGVGPIGFDRLPLGGDAVLIFNNEIRLPLVSRFDGVGFVDIGNVYRHVSDISLTDLRKAAGLGLRVRTPWFLLRLDYGLKLDRRPGESMGRLFFSIGQAF